MRNGKGVGADAPPTVYRALDFLMANGFVHKLESVNAFVACHHPSSAAHSVPFLICNSCHSAVELEDREIVTQLEKRARSWVSSRRRRPWKCTDSARAAPANAR